MAVSPAITLTKKLITIDSTNPGAFEGNIGDFLWQELSRIPGARLSREEILPGRSNLMAELPGDPRNEPPLVLICHIDTVVAGEGWSFPPFEATEKNGRIYGRGACDMKSGLACCLSAFSHTARRLQKEQIRMKRSLKLIFTVDEEDFMRGVESCIKSGWIGRHDWILDAEPTGGQIQGAHKGRLWYEIDVTGRTAHASTPWKGADAVAAMAEIIRHIRLAIRETPPHPALGSPTVTFGQITGGYRPYVVPDHCKVWTDIRLTPYLDQNAAEQIVSDAFALAEREIPGIRASRRITGMRPAIELDSTSPLLEKLQYACLLVTGALPDIGIFPGYTDTAVAAGILGSRNCMSYGPGHLECAHQPDEWVETADILRCEQVFCTLIEMCCLTEK